MKYEKRVKALEQKVKRMQRKDLQPKLKVCSKDPTHTWISDIPFCPYCNLSPEARVYYQREAEKKETK